MIVILINEKKRKTLKKMDSENKFIIFIASLRRKIFYLDQISHRALARCASVLL